MISERFFATVKIQNIVLSSKKIGRYILTI